MPLKGRRWVIGHINVLSPHDIERIVRMGLVVTPHTNSNLYKEGHTWQAKLPPERQAWNTPLRDLLDAGVKVGLVTDNVPVSLFWPIWETVTRLSRVTNAPIAPAQALTRAGGAALRDRSAAPISPTTRTRRARSNPASSPTSRCSPPIRSPARSPTIRDIAADMTMVGGRIVHRTPNWRG